MNFVCQLVLPLESIKLVAVSQRNDSTFDKIVILFNKTIKCFLYLIADCDFIKRIWNYLRNNFNLILRLVICRWRLWPMPAHTTPANAMTYSS